MSIKEQYRRFKEWQQNPFEHHQSEVHRKCANCGLEFTGDYCPCCGQRGDVGRITVKSLLSSLTMIWGLDSRSMLYTLWQLLLRPGYLIYDYLKGKRQSSFPPVKMLFILTVLLSLLQMLLNPQSASSPELDESEFLFMNKFYVWANSHMALSVLFSLLSFILPVWLLFRESPRYPHHTLTEGFFIQSFLASLILIFYIVPDKLLSGCLPDFFTSVLVIILYFAYKQLFGYSIWGTLWRLVVLAFSTFLICAEVVALLALFIESTADEKSKYGWAILALLSLLVLALGAGYLLDHLSARRRRKSHA